MKLSELLPEAAKMTHLQLKAYALVLSPELTQALNEIQSGLPGERRHKAVPIPLTNGNYILRADLLTEIHAKGAYRGGFSAIPPHLFSAVEIGDWDQLITTAITGEVE